MYRKMYPKLVKNGLKGYDMNATTFRKDMFSCLAEVRDGAPLTITNKNDVYVIMNENDYKALWETIYLASDLVTLKSLTTPSENETWFDEKELAWNSGN